MDRLSKKISSFSIELRIIQVQNVESIKSKGNLFVRLYLPLGNNKKIQLNTKKVPLKSFPFWDNDSFNLECSCPQEFLDTLKHESLVLELRQSKKLFGSQIVGKGEVPWKEVLDESPNMELKKWVTIDNLVSGSGNLQEAMFKAPQVLMEIKTQVENRKKLNYKWDECGCKHGHDHNAWISAEDYDVFALGAALEAF